MTSILLPATNGFTEATKGLGLLVCLSLSMLPAAAQARVVSYAPVTDRSVVPVVQLRTNRHYVLIETEAARGCPIYTKAARLVVYDSTGAEPPREVSPLSSGSAYILSAAAFEADGVLRLVVETDGERSTPDGTPNGRTFYSPDGGVSWKRVTRPRGLPYMEPIRTDQGGPLVGGDVARTRIVPATREVPFVFSSGPGLYGIQADGTLRTIAEGISLLMLVGSNRERTRFVVVGNLLDVSTLDFYAVDISGSVTTLLRGVSLPVTRAWLAGPDSLYVQMQRALAPFPKPPGLFLVEGGRPVEVAVPSFSQPTDDYRGAWLVERGGGLPTVLSRHTKETGLVVQWADVTGPELEAIHTGASGNTLLLQVHRPRAVSDPRLTTFRDPAFAVWRMGEPAPVSYDELYLIENSPKGFVQLDVDAVAAGAPFTFDSGTGSMACEGGPGGGAAVVQEWGTVRASLKQTLVIPAVARAQGVFGSHWRTELVLHNPDSAPVEVGISFVPTNAEVRDRRIAVVRLEAKEIRVVPDVLTSLFHLESGAGALLLQPHGRSDISATSRTTTSGPGGSFGMGISAIDLYTAAGPRFPLTFSAALLGDGFRSNLAVVDASGHGLSASLLFDDGTLQKTVLMTAPAGGQDQLNDLASLAALEPWKTSSMVLQPSRGESIPALIVIDNRTNDPTYFPPDLPSPFVRTIPALVHADGANGARFRSDLVLSNTTGLIASVTLAAKPWDSPEAERVVVLSVLPRESKVVRDALHTIFGMSGVARLRFISGTSLFIAPSDSGDVRVTSRTYTLLPDGGTYGLLIPPLNSFQSAGSGESLEILGARGGASFRTNLSLVELTPSADGTNPRVAVEIVDGHGRTIDSFETTVPLAGGRQVDDIFRARGLGDGPEAALIRVRPFGGQVAAYATLIDQGTNDPVYLPAGLGAR